MGEVRMVGREAEESVCKGDPKMIEWPGWLVEPTQSGGYGQTGSQK